MGYLFLGFSLLAGATKGYCGKRLGNTTEKTFDAVLLNLVRMIFCIIIGLALILSTVMATLIFKENFNVKCLLGITTAFAGIIFINILSF